MTFDEKVTISDLKSHGIPTYNNCEHYYVKTHPNTNQTLVIDVGGGKYLTVCVMPGADSVDVKFHGKHRSSVLESREEDNTVHAFFGWRGE